MPTQFPVYILAAAAISAQASFEQMMYEPANYCGDRLICIEPDYAKYVDTKLIRRMSRIIKMGVATALEALKQAPVKNPDAIITGTAYGCLADTDQFLTRMVEFKETLLSPTAFIQSTHNTVAAQIALILQCHSYNNTYVHRGSSFEAALTDSISLLVESEAQYILLGAADEITPKSHTIMQRLGVYKRQANSLDLPLSDTKGTMAGDGAAFFVVSSQMHDAALAKLVSFKNYYKPKKLVSDLLQSFMEENNVNSEAIDLVIMGSSGDKKENQHYNDLAQQFFLNNDITTYKQYCGEYPTSSAFALWMAAQILNKQRWQQKPVKNILIYNNYLLNYPVFYLLSAC